MIKQIPNHNYYCPSSPSQSIKLQRAIGHLSASQCQSASICWLLSSSEPDNSHQMDTTAKIDWLFQPLNGYPGCRQVEETVVIRYIYHYNNKVVVLTTEWLPWLPDKLKRLWLRIGQPHRKLPRPPYNQIYIVATEHASLKEVTSACIKEPTMILQIQLVATEKSPQTEHQCSCSDSLRCSEGCQL